MDLQSTKLCRACQRELPVSDFWKNRANKDGLQAYCKPCLRAKNEPGFVRYRQAHADRLAKSGRDYSARNRESRNRNSEQYRLKNLLRYREHASRRRARERATMIEPIDFDAIYRRDNGICHICHNPVPKSRLHYDHVIPLAKGGTHTMDNLKVSHGRCNLKKGDRVIIQNASATV